MLLQNFSEILFQALPKWGRRGNKKSKLKREKRRENKRGSFWGYRNGRRWSNHCPLHILHLSPCLCKWISEQVLSLTEILFCSIFVLPGIWIIALLRQKVWFPYFTCIYILSVAMLCTLIIWFWKHPFVLFLSSEQHFFFPADPMTEKNWSWDKKWQLKLSLNRKEAKGKHFSEETEFRSSATC